MKRDMITLYEAKDNKSAGCHNCMHRYGLSREFWRCSRVGLYTDIEMRFGDKCNVGGDLLLWAPRKGLLQKLFHLLVRGAQ